MPMINGANEVRNPAEALVNQEGIFEVVSPTGKVFEVTCRRGHGMTFKQIRAMEDTQSASQENWLIRQLPEQHV